MPDWLDAINPFNSLLARHPVQVGRSGDSTPPAEGAPPKPASAGGAGPAGPGPQGPNPLDKLDGYVAPTVSSLAAGSPAADAARWSLYGLDAATATALVHTQGGDKSIGAFLDSTYMLSSQSPTQFEGLQRKLYKAGFLGDKPGDIAWGQMDGTTLKGLSTALVRAAQYSIDGKTTFEDVLDRTDAATADPLGVNGGRPSLAGTRTQKSVNYSSEADAGNYLNDAMASLLGRRPTSAEVGRFHKVLNQQEKSHPAITKTTTDENGTVTYQSQDGGMDSADYATNAQSDIYANHGKEYAQVATDSLSDAFAKLMLGS